MSNSLKESVHTSFVFTSCAVCFWYIMLNWIKTANSQFTRHTISFALDSTAAERFRKHFETQIQFIQSNNQFNEHSTSYTNWTQASSQSLLTKSWTPGGIQESHSQTHKYICITRTIKLLVISQQASRWVVSAKWLLSSVVGRFAINSWHSAHHCTCPLVQSEQRWAGPFNLLYLWELRDRHAQGIVGLTTDRS